MRARQYTSCVERRICTTCGSQPAKPERLSCQHCLNRYAEKRKSRAGGQRREHSWASDTRVLRELVLEHVGRRPTTARELFDRVRDDFGTVGERRLWRVIALHVARGAIVPVNAKIAPGKPGSGRYDSDGYVRA